MFYNLRSPMKRRLILLLRECFGRHPIYNKVAIQDRYDWDVRPQIGIVVKGSSTSNVALSPDNFVGTLESHVMLAYVPGKLPAFPLEWVREDSYKVEKGTLATPGAYFLEITNAPTSAGEIGEFVIDPIYRVSQEPLIEFVTGYETEAELEHEPLAPTLHLWENNRYLLMPGVDFTLDGKKVTFLHSSFPRYKITASYYYPSETQGPFPFQWNTSVRDVIPGAVLAFGKRAVKGDQVAVVVTEKRTDTAAAYGGRISISFDIDIFARDQTQQEEVCDLAYMALWADMRSALGDEGIDISEVSSGGESEESYDENAQDPYYTSNLSVTLQTDWEIHVPYPLVIAKVTPTSQALEDSQQGQEINQIVLTPDLIHVVENIPPRPYVLKGAERLH